MAFLAEILEPPSYGYERGGELYIPNRKELTKEFFERINPFRDRRNWVPAFSWATTLSFAIPLALFLIYFFSWPLLIVGFVYSMIVLGTHGTIWYHRYSTHRAYQFSHPIWHFITRNLVVKVIIEEAYVVSHHVHHFISERPGDPYNVNAGWWYCFLADAVHQPIARDLSPNEYERVASMVRHCGVHVNSYAAYKKWGSIAHPAWTTLHFALNWTFWYGAFYLIGGHALALACFGSCGVWGIGVRTFNYDGHGAGKDKRRDGIDFNRKDLSINQVWPGVVTGEWHNNHHLYPNGARAGFLPYQFDPAWVYIRGLSLIGGVSGFRDYRDEFMQKHYLPYLKAKASGSGECLPQEVVGSDAR